MKKRSEKQQDLDKLKTELAKVSTVILSTFQGITVEDDTKLRRAVQAAGGKYKVVKNTLAERAGAGTLAENLLKNLSGTNSIAYTAADPVALAKALTKVAKDVPAFQFKSGVVEGRVISIGDSATGESSVEGRADQQDHVPAERSGAAHRHGTERVAAQRGSDGKRGYQGEQVWVRRRQCSTGSRSGPVSSSSRIERRRKSHGESRYDPGRNQGADVAGSVRSREEDGRSLRRLRSGSNRGGGGRRRGGSGRRGTGGREDGILRCTDGRWRQQDQRH